MFNIFEHSLITLLRTLVLICQALSLIEKNFIKNNSKKFTKFENYSKL